MEKDNYKDNYKVNVNINKLRNEVQSRENRKFKTFEKVLEMCYHKILTTNKTSDECCCTFICPQVIFGLPLFNLMECINFIMEKLIEKGYKMLEDIIENTSNAGCKFRSILTPHSVSC